MRIDELTLERFRNYRCQRVEFDPRCNVIYGENAQGKTNLLEAIAYLSSGRSPRARSDREIIGFEEQDAMIGARVFARDREFAMEVELYRGRRRRMRVNQVAAKTAAELSAVFNTVFFCPEDLYLIRDGAAARRKFLDGCLCQLRPRYASALSNYNKVYEHKTRILRDWGEKPSLLEALPEFNEQMAVAGAVVIHYRAQLCRRLGEYAAAAHGECSGGREELRLVYQTVATVEDPLGSVGDIAEQLRIHQRSHESAERAAGLCLSGPHKDDIEVFIGGRSARIYSSQGQTRTAALALKLAEREIYQNVTGEYPVLLLDDVLSELDERRQEYVLNRISGGQVFITCCEDDRLEELLGGRVFHVERGIIR
ncbi:DNA replication/repair protein RecF [Oscillibacter sp. MSJ-2]|uniref:DNA replication and repair protein RecF n=1 Tax=Dysosmobacter acutus TaxID=2841504 RepID=A0ABS6F630_9FIRM|nr:DNA replication/repair protein RecF [Dysosmobacter acutus]MBU5625748.1 DNA replication/repair protein RecF [Dysosmobacter acutus]